MRILILGCGRLGAEVARFLDELGHDITVMDDESEGFMYLPRNFHGSTVIGSSMEQEVLRHAGIEQCDAFIALTNGDNRNIMAGQLAKELFHVPRVIVQIKDPEREATFRALGLETICPTTLGADALHRAIIDSGNAAPNAAT